jgi:hypothetical protein
MKRFLLGPLDGANFDPWIRDSSELWKAVCSVSDGTVILTYAARGQLLLSLPFRRELLFLLCPVKSQPLFLLFPAKGQLLFFLCSTKTLLVSFCALQNSNYSSCCPGKVGLFMAEGSYWALWVPSFSSPFMAPIGHSHILWPISLPSIKLANFIHFYPEGGGNVFLHKPGDHLPDYSVS